MLTAMRTAVTDLLESQDLPFDIYGFVPGDVATYPCIVVGRPDAPESVEARSVFDITVDVYVCGRAQSDDAQDELDKVADQVWQIFGGTRNAVPVSSSSPSRRSRRRSSTSPAPPTSPPTC